MAFSGRLAKMSPLLRVMIGPEVEVLVRLYLVHGTLGGVFPIRVRTREKSVRFPRNLLRKPSDVNAPLFGSVHLMTGRLSFPLMQYISDSTG